MKKIIVLAAVMGLSPQIHASEVGLKCTGKLYLEANGDKLELKGAATLNMVEGQYYQLYCQKQNRNQDCRSACMDMRNGWGYQACLQQCGVL